MSTPDSNRERGSTAGDEQGRETTRQPALMETGQSEYAHLRVPRRVLADLGMALLTGGQRSFASHAWRMMAGVQPPLRVLGADHIPQSGPGVITVNHYNRPCFWSPWFPAVISAQIPAAVHWTMTDAFTFPGHRLGRLYRWLSHLILTQVARVYGFNTMPPMPPMPGEEALRAVAVQRLVAYVRNHPDALLGLAPEGGDQPGGVLNDPPEGFGRLALLLARRGMHFYPVGVYDEAGCLYVHFGPKYELTLPEQPERRMLDRLARDEVMRHIAACVPDRLRGFYRG